MLSHRIKILLIVIFFLGISVLGFYAGRALPDLLAPDREEISKDIIAASVVPPKIEDSIVPNIPPSDMLVVTHPSFGQMSFRRTFTKPIFDQEGYLSLVVEGAEGEDIAEGWQAVLRRKESGDIFPHLLKVQKILPARQKGKKQIQFELNKNLFALLNDDQETDLSDFHLELVIAEKAEARRLPLTAIGTDIEGHHFVWQVMRGADGAVILARRDVQILSQDDVFAEVPHALRTDYLFALNAEDQNLKQGQNVRHIRIPEHQPDDFMAAQQVQQRQVAIARANFEEVEYTKYVALGAGSCQQKALDRQGVPLYKPPCQNCAAAAAKASGKNGAGAPSAAAGGGSTCGTCTANAAARAADAARGDY